MCGAEKQSQSVRAHEGVVGSRKSQRTPGFTWNSGTCIVYNSHVTCSKSSFSLTMVTPTSHFLAFHWLCCLLPIGYLPKPVSVGVGICHHHRIKTRPQVKVIFQYLRPDTPVSTCTVFTGPVGMVTFRQSPCWYYPWVDPAISTSTDTKHLGTWWHFGDHTGFINLSVNNIPRIHTRRLRLYIAQKLYVFTDN